MNCDCDSAFFVGVFVGVFCGFVAVVLENQKKGK